MRGKKRDWTGVTQGNLTVIKEVGRDHEGNVLWECRCTCGVVCVKPNKMLAAGTKSCSVQCGVSRSNAGRAEHGMYTTKEFKAWTSMKQRCTNPDCTQFKRYGARGISVHSAWLSSFSQFLADIGPAPDKSMTLERIDNNKGYEPGNVRWATRREQSNNRGVTLRSEIDGVEMTLSEIAAMYDVPYHAVFGRYRRGLRGRELITRQKTGRKPKTRK